MKTKSKPKANSAKVVVRALQAVRYLGVRYTYGNTFRCDTDTASRLMRLGVVEISHQREVSTGVRIPASAHSLLPGRAPSGPSPDDGSSSPSASEESGEIPGLNG